MLGWIFIGLVAGLIASRRAKRKKEGLFGEAFLRDITLGVVGAFAAGYAYNAFAQRDVVELNIPGVVLAAFGSITILASYYWLLSQKVTARRKRW